MTTDLKALAIRRVSCRCFSSEDVPIEHVYRAIDVAREAPSGLNSQPWRFIIVREKDTKEKVKRICEKLEKKELHGATGVL